MGTIPNNKTMKN